jgi:hypothetical protein
MAWWAPPGKLSGDKRSDFVLPTQLASFEIEAITFCSGEIREIGYGYTTKLENIFGMFLGGRSCITFLRDTTVSIPASAFVYTNHQLPPRHRHHPAGTSFFNAFFSTSARLNSCSTTPMNVYCNPIDNFKPLNSIYKVLYIYKSKSKFIFLHRRRLARCKCL